MKRKHKRMIIIALCAAVVGLGATLILSAFQDNLVFFYTPSQVPGSAYNADKNIRVGGLVEVGSVNHNTDNSLTFVITDQQESIAVHYKGLVPSLFREGQGVVAEGHFIDNNLFEAKQILAKHDENYMPPEVVRVLKESDHWQTDEKPIGIDVRP